ncbi:MAG TPA: hypothetical protein VF678_10980 [bacterium]
MVTLLRYAPRACLLASAALILLGLPRPVHAANGSVVFLTVKYGTQNADGTGDTLFKQLENDHGTLKDSRDVVLQGVELDFYSATSRNAGLAVGLELQQYSKSFRFRATNGTQTDEDLKFAGRAVLFSLKGFLRWGPVLPFFGVGSGNYYVQYHQATENISLLDSAPNVFTARVGARVLVAGHWGVLLETGQTSAPVRIHTQSGNASLNLGGNFTSAGISYAW